MNKNNCVHEYTNKWNANSEKISDNEPVLQKTQLNISRIQTRYTTYTQHRKGGLSSVGSHQSLIKNKLIVAIETDIKAHSNVYNFFIKSLGVMMIHIAI